MMKIAVANKWHATRLNALLLCILCLILSSCHTDSCTLQPCITYIPNTHQIEELPSAFPPLNKEEAKREWARELYLGGKFARELDLYRAITAYKRAYFLLSRDQAERRKQIEFCIIQCYYLGQKYPEAVYAYESSSLIDFDPAFPAQRELLIILSDAYAQINLEDKAGYCRECLEKFDPNTAKDFDLSDAILDADFSSLDVESAPFLCDYYANAKSVRKAQALQAVLPGAGYLYVGQKKTAFTSLVINSLFIAAAYYFFDHGNPAAGIITASLEAGWYMGGINGAGLAAKEYNARVYELQAKDFMIRRKLFPVLMFQKTF